MQQHQPRGHINMTTPLLDYDDKSRRHAGMLGRTAPRLSPSSIDAHICVAAVWRSPTWTESDINMAEDQSASPSTHSPVFFGSLFRHQLIALGALGLV